MSSSLEGRVAVVFGVANKRSIAWSIAQGLHEAGAKLAVTYQNERLEMEAKDLILSLPGRGSLHVRCVGRRRHRPPFRATQRAVWQVARPGAQRGLCSCRGIERENFSPLHGKVFASPTTSASIHWWHSPARPRR